MKPKTIILMVVAIVCGLGASYMTSRLLAEREEQKPKEVPEVPKVKILVAKMHLDNGAAIKDPAVMFVEKTVTKDDAPKDGLTDAKVLKGKFLKRPLRAGDHITYEDLVDEKVSILANLPDGYRAYGIRVDAEAVASGFASLPGSMVDIAWTRRSGNDNASFTKILLENVQVLAADQKVTGENDNRAMLASVVTVALTVNDAMKAKLAAGYGQLTLLLRKPGDVKPVPEKDKATMADLMAAREDKTKGKKKAKDGQDEPAEEPVDPLDPLAKVPDVKNDKPEVKKPAPPKKFYREITFRVGDKQWREKFEVDAKGNLIVEPVEGEELIAPPGLDPQQQTQPAQPAQPGKEDEKKDQGNKVGPEKKGD